MSKKASTAPAARVASSNLNSIENNFGIGWMESVLARNTGTVDNIMGNPQEDLGRYWNAVGTLLVKTLVPMLLCGGK
jgi:hypothetical protein